MADLALNKLITKKLDWQYSTTELFGYFSHLPWAVLLDSADATHQDARYDIIVLAPIATLVSQDNLITLDVYENNSSNLNEQLVLESKIIDNNDPFAAIQQTLSQLFPVPCPSSLPFSAGALGSFSYDLGRSIEHLPSKAAKDIQFAELNMGFYQWALVYDYVDKSWSLSHYHGAQCLDNTLATLNQYIEEKAFERAFLPAVNFELTGDWQRQISLDEYQQKFEAIQHYLHAGDCYQINLTQRFTADYSGDEWQAYLKLRQSNQAPFSAFMRLPSSAVLSISPERFLQLNGRQIQTKPIKGTSPRALDPAQDKLSAQALQHSEKDRAENLMIVDLLRNDIGKVAAPGSVQVPHLFDIESFPAVHHLVSTVTAVLDDAYQSSDLLRAAFPGGSITGAPKIRAMEIIEELEPSRRSLYCGSIGYISQDDKMDTSITIRTLVATEQKIHCWAGGGIVADSKLEAEYQETYDKVSKILPTLAE